MDLDPQKTAFIFPGQGSQAVGMGRELAAAFPVARAVFAQSEASLETPITEICWQGPEDRLNDTVNTQPALLTHSIAALRVFETYRPDFRPRYVAGHSLGELSALVPAGALSFSDALLLTRRRGELMKSAGQTNPGGMAALLGLEIEQVELLCEQASEGEDRVQIANDNCPGQVVVSGAGRALKRLMPLAERAGVRKFVPLAVSIAAHSYLMQQAQDDFNLAVDQAHLQDPQVGIIGNVSALPLLRARDIEDDLKAQLTARVRWTETIQFMLEQGVDTFVEIGTGGVLSGLIKRIDRKTRRVTLGEPEDFSIF